MIDVVYFIVFLSNGNSNILKVIDLFINFDNNLIVEVDFFFLLCNFDGSWIEILFGLFLLFDYRLVIIFDLNEVFDSEVIF